MKTIWDILFFIVCVGVTGGLAYTCAGKVTPSSNSVKYITVTDTVKIAELENVLQLTRDSLNAYKSDTIMGEDEFVLRYKLERIKYYHELAGKGNNAKFLRGWIGRVINE